jgi:tetratricopeptide (TPR) repeat protein
MGIFYYNTAIRLQDSVQRYETQLQATPNDKQAAQMLDEFLHKRLDNFYKAVPRFQKVVAIDSKDEDTWRLLAICNYSLASLLSDLQARQLGPAPMIRRACGMKPKRRWRRPTITSPSTRTSAI